MPLPSPRTTARACRARVLRRERRPEAKLACGRPERPSDGTAMRRGCAVLMAPLLAPLGAVQTHSWRGRVYQRLSPVCRAEKHTVRFDRQRPVRCRHVADPRHCPRPLQDPWTLTRPTAARTRELPLHGHKHPLRPECKTDPAGSCVSDSCGGEVVEQFSSVEGRRHRVTSDRSKTRPLTRPTVPRPHGD